MGIFKSTDTSGYDVVVYTKYCLECEEQSAAELAKLKAWATREKLVVKVVRTAYRPADHERASKLYGNEDYPAIVIWDEVTTLTDFAKDCKNKLIKAGKEKNGETADKGQGEA